jgi:hypothetical protein
MLVVIRLEHIRLFCKTQTTRYTERHFFYCWKQSVCVGVRRMKQLSKLGCQILHYQKLHE